MTDNEFVRVRYKFKNDRNFIAITVTEQQYLNLIELPMMEKCEIIDKAVKPLTEEEKEKFNEKIRIACKNNQSHTKYLLK